MVLSALLPEVSESFSLIIALRTLNAPIRTRDYLSGSESIYFITRIEA
jgi:hypothetical protein